MGVCKRAQVRGIQHVMIGSGLVSYPTAKHAEESADLIADNLEEMPETTGEEGLSPEEAAEVMDDIVNVANEIAEKTGFDRSNPDLEKAASAVGIETAAHAHALALMEKAAGETDVTGDGQHHEQYADGGMAEQDIQDNPSSEIVVPQGTTQFDTSAGEVGAQEPQTPAPGYAPPISNEVSKLSSFLKKLSMEGDTATGDGTPGAGTGNPPGRKDLETNLGMPKETVVREQGTTQQKPHIPVPTVPNPAAAGVTQESKPKTDVQKDVGKVAAAILAHPDKDAILAKLAKELPPEFLKKKEEMKEEGGEKKEEKEEEKSESKAEEKKEEAKKEESEKEAALFDVLARIAEANAS